MYMLALFPGFLRGRGLSMRLMYMYMYMYIWYMHDLIRQQKSMYACSMPLYGPAFSYKL